MITPAEAERFAREWLAAWNSHDPEAVLALCAEEVELVSPFVVQLMGDPAGLLRGKDSLRMYLHLGLSLYPDLHLELLQVLVGVSSVVLFYRSVDDTLGAEVLVLDDQRKAARVLAHYLPVE